jgi:hypothetical protein
MVLSNLISRLMGGRDAPRVAGGAFLNTVLAAAPAAVAASAAIDLAFVGEVKAAARDELFRLDEMVEGDLGLANGRIMVAAPKQIFDPNVRVWRSVAAEAGAWADYISTKTGVKRDKCLTVCTRLARLVDVDLRAAEITSETKIDVSLPHVTRTWSDRWGEKHCEVGLGVHKNKLFDGSEQWGVHFKGVKPALVDVNGKAFSIPQDPPPGFKPPRPLEGRGEGWTDVGERLRGAQANDGWNAPVHWSARQDRRPII